MFWSIELWQEGKKRVGQEALSQWSLLENVANHGKQKQEVEELYPYTAKGQRAPLACMMLWVQLPALYYILKTSDR